MFDYLIVGAGFAGSVLAERLASQSRKKVLLIDRRLHIGGNAYDRYDNEGILIHPYGPHIFHTNSERISGYLSQFTEWRTYEHRVLASVDGQFLPIPINRTTVNKLYNLNLETEAEVEAFYASRAEFVGHAKTSEDAVVGKVGRDLYEKFFRGYTRKMWAMDPSELDAQVAARIPARTSTDDRYFTDTFQSMPLHGYSKMFEKMLDHPNIKIMLNTDWREVKALMPAHEIIFTGPVDEYFDHRFGRLPYRSLEFKHETRDASDGQIAATLNYPNEHAHTRTTEMKWITGQTHEKTDITYEYPRAGGDPYYPIPSPACNALYARYKDLADSTHGVHFAGRLGTYKYYNMDQVVGQALALYDKLSTSRPERIIVTSEPNVALASTPGKAVSNGVAQPV